MQWNQSWQMYALGSAFFAGLTAIFGKVGVQNINSDVATFIRTVIILFVLAAVISIKVVWQRPDEIGTRTWVFLALSAFATGGSWLCYYRALQLGPASRVAPVDKLSVGFAMILAFVFLGETVNWRVAAGGVLVVAGAVVMALG